MTPDEKRLLKLAYVIIRNLPVNQANQKFVDGYLEWEKRAKREEDLLALWNQGFYKDGN